MSEKNQCVIKYVRRRDVCVCVCGHTQKTGS